MLNELVYYHKQDISHLNISNLDNVPPGPEWDMFKVGDVQVGVVLEAYRPFSYILIMFATHILNIFNSSYLHMHIIFLFFSISKSMLPSQKFQNYFKIWICFRCWFFQFIDIGCSITNISNWNIYKCFANNAS